MAISARPIDINTLKRFTPFSTLNKELVDMLMADIAVHHATKGKCLFSLNENTDEQYFLVNGSVRLQSQDQQESIIEAGMPNSNTPLSRTSPRQHSAFAASDIDYFTVNACVWNELNRSINKPADYFSLLARANTLDESGNALLHLFQHELIRGSFLLPSIPDIAQKIRQTIDNPTCTTKEVATLISGDPAMAAKLIQAANSPICRGISSCEDLTSAITRLGLTTTKQLVTSFAVLGLFKSDSTLLRSHMENLRYQSVTVATYSRALANELPGFNADEALLIGLLHTIGTLVVLSYADQFNELDNNELLLSVIVHHLSSSVGALVMDDWGFSNNVIIVARESANWLRQNEQAIDYCDIIIIAKLCALLNNNAADLLTRPSLFPAINKLQQQQLSTQQITRVVEQAQQQVSELQHVFAT